MRCQAGQETVRDLTARHQAAVEPAPGPGAQRRRVGQPRRIVSWNGRGLPGPPQRREHRPGPRLVGVGGQGPGPVPVGQVKPPQLRRTVLRPVGPGPVRPEPPRPAGLPAAWSRPAARSARRAARPGRASRATARRPAGENRRASQPPGPGRGWPAASARPAGSGAVPPAARAAGPGVRPGWASAAPPCGPAVPAGPAAGHRRRSLVCLPRGASCRRRASKRSAGFGRLVLGAGIPLRRFAGRAGGAPGCTARRSAPRLRHIRRTAGS